MKRTRRGFIRDGAALALATAGSGALGFPGLAGAATPPLRKCISLSGPGPLGADGYPDDYRYWGNREYVLASNTRWVKLWVDWHYLQEELGRAPVSRAASWAHLNSAPGGQRALRRLDAQLKAINDDSRTLSQQGRGRIGAILCIYQSFPTWASAGTEDQKLSDPARYGKPIEAKYPDDRSVQGPWAWFVSHLMARYRYGAAANPRGPHEPDSSDTGGYDPRFGNPDGAWLDRLEVMNEPNLLWWPQSGVHLGVAAMTRTAAALAQQWGFSGSRHGLLIPATSDYPDPTEGVSTVKATDWRTFTERVLRTLSGWRPSVYVGWSHHNFKDVKYGGYAGATSRAALVRDRLYSYNWRLGGDRYVFLTEGGYDCREDLGDDLISDAELARQRDLIRTSYELMRTTPDVPLWTQHGIHDKPNRGNDFKSALRGDFRWSVPEPGPPKPSWYLWRDELPGAADI